MIGVVETPPCFSGFNAFHVIQFFFYDLAIAPERDQRENKGKDAFRGPFFSWPAILQRKVFIGTFLRDPFSPVNANIAITISQTFL
jgi:hypothetical protein